MLLIGCAEFPGVYKIDIEQGNVITQEMIDQLRPDMTKRQVRFIMGAPLVKDTFNQERWDYIHSISRRGNKRDQINLSLFFEDEGRLLSLTSRYFKPNSALPYQQPS
jgi:outer membrane protein assembly factor BamE